jgi:hypothetical protein
MASTQIQFRDAKLDQEFAQRVDLPEVSEEMTPEQEKENESYKARMFSEEARKSLKFYYYGLRYTFLRIYPRLTVNEMMFLIDVFNGTILEPYSIPAMDGDIEFKIREGYAEKHEIDGKAFLERFKTFSYFEMLSIADAIERYWQGSYYKSDMKERIYELGLAPREETTQKSSEE